MTRTSVTVTNPRRGSLIRVSSICATISLMRSASFLARGWSTMSSSFRAEPSGDGPDDRTSNGAHRPGG
ncbi:Uncharacterised protein [Mycobacteroides abscessus]|nr:Uncharacterised protein [Mycobacteroides abscessus]